MDGGKVGGGEKGWQRGDKRSGRRAYGGRPAEKRAVKAAPWLAGRWIGHGWRVEDGQGAAGRETGRDWRTEMGLGRRGSEWPRLADRNGPWAAGQRVAATGGPKWAQRGGAASGRDWRTEIGPGRRAEGLAAADEPSDCGNRRAARSCRIERLAVSKKREEWAAKRRAPRMTVRERPAPGRKARPQRDGPQETGHKGQDRKESPPISELPRMALSSGQQTHRKRAPREVAAKPAPSDEPTTSTTVIA
jgi:hypothetical protein